MILSVSATLQWLHVRHTTPNRIEFWTGVVRVMFIRMKSWICASIMLSRGPFEMMWVANEMFLHLIQRASPLHFFRSVSQTLLPWPTLAVRRVKSITKKSIISPCGIWCDVSKHDDYADNIFISCRRHLLGAKSSVSNREHSIRRLMRFRIKFYHRQSEAIYFGCSLTPIRLWRIHIRSLTLRMPFGMVLPTTHHCVAKWNNLQFRMNAVRLSRSASMSNAPLQYERLTFWY